MTSRTSLRSYRVFGGILQSELDLPDLPEAEPRVGQPADWTVRRGEVPDPTSDSRLLGQEEVQADVDVRLVQDGPAWRLEYDDTGVFQISDDGHDIVWDPGTRGLPEMDAVRKDILGRVLAVALHRSGVPSLHGSAAVVGRTALVFVAPKGHGKSTTALALVKQGGRLLADDTVAVASPEDGPTVLPGVPSVLLWRDSADRVAPADVVGDPRPDEDSKISLGLRGSGVVARRPAPLGAVYLVSPVPPESAETPERVALGRRDAVMALVGQGKIVRLLGTRVMSDLLGPMDAVAASTPVYRLRVPRNLDRLEDLVDRLRGWHGRSAPSEAVGLET
jgi:hypothetical protein